MSRNNKNKTLKFGNLTFSSGPAAMGPVASRIAATGHTVLANSVAKAESQQRVLNRLRAAGATHLANSMKPHILPNNPNKSVLSMFSKGAAIATMATPATVSASPYTFVHPPKVNSDYNSNNWSRIISGYSKKSRKNSRSKQKTRRNHRK